MKESTEVKTKKDNEIVMLQSDITKLIEKSKLQARKDLAKKIRKAWKESNIPADMFIKQILRTLRGLK